MATAQKEVNGGDNEPENIQELTKTVNICIPLLCTRFRL